MLCLVGFSAVIVCMCVIPNLFKVCSSAYKMICRFNYWPPMQKSSLEKSNQNFFLNLAQNSVEIPALQGFLLNPVRIPIWLATESKIQQDFQYNCQFPIGILIRSYWNFLKGIILFAGLTQWISNLMVIFIVQGCTFPSP